MKVLQVVASINRDTGGPALTVPRLAGALAALGVEATLATLDYPALGTQTPTPGVTCATMRAGAVTQLLRGWSPGFAREVRRLAGAGTEIVHDHGLWMFPNVYARRAAAAAGLPLIVSPRGMLDHWSLGRSRLRKWIAWQAFQRANLQSARLLHATSDAEAAAIRAAGFRQPVAIVPNGVDVPDAMSLPDRLLLERVFPNLQGRRWILFLSRLHPKKGIPRLLESWRALQSVHPEWHLVIAGPDFAGHGERMRSLALELGVAARTTFTGALDGERKACALHHAGVLVLPTESENFGVVVAEALAHGTPVLTTRAAPWPELEENGCGWWVDVSEPALRSALDAALRLSPEERQRMGSRGRELVAARYGWTGVAVRMHATYQWLLGTGPRPDCVFPD